MKKKLELISKWGFDGASIQSNYKQTSKADSDDSSVFMGSLVPMKPVNGDRILWENPAPNSTYFCRPLFFKFIKQTHINITTQMQRLESERSTLKETEIHGKFI